MVQHLLRQISPLASAYPFLLSSGRRSSSSPDGYPCRGRIKGRQNLSNRSAYPFRSISHISRYLVMVKSVLGVNHQGLRDWVMQRISAILMAVYSIGLITYIVLYPDLSYPDWRALFAQTWVKVATLLFIVSVLFHAWIGMWTVFTDYIKSYVIRCILNFLVLLMLAACFFWGVLILWSV